MAITKNLGAIRKLSGGNIYVKRVSNSGGAVTGATWFPLGYIQESTLGAEGTNEDIKDETGDTVTSIETDFTVKLTGVLMQCDKEVLDFLASSGSYESTGTKNNYFAVIAARGNVDGKTQEVAGAICKFKRGFTDASGTRRPSFEITFLKNTTGSAIAVTPPAGIFTATTFSVPANGFYEIKES